MTIDNAAHLRTFAQKAALAVSDLYDSDGGAIQPAVFKEFVEATTLQSQIIKDMETATMQAPTEKVNKIKFGDQVLYPRSPGEAMPTQYRVVPNRSEEELVAKMFGFQATWEEEVEDENIEGPRLRAKIMGLLSKAVARDMEKVVINGDTTSTDVTLAVMNGIVKMATSNLVNGANGTLSDDMLFAADRTMPSEYEQEARNMVYWTHKKAVLDLDKSRAGRATLLGDKSIEGHDGPRHNYVPVKKVGLWRDDIGAASTTVALYLDPKNVKIGIYKKMRVKIVVDDMADAINVVGKVRWAVKYKEEPGVVKIYDVSAA